MVWYWDIPVPQIDTLLDIASFVTPIADAVLVIKDLSEGDYSGAAINGIGFIPVLVLLC